MDIVVYYEKIIQDDSSNKLTKKKLGAIQEDGTLAPLSAWSTEPAFGNSIEFLVDEHDRFPGLRPDDKNNNIFITRLLPEHGISYGSRQVGGGKGPGNPHGEESELLYYVDQDALLKDDDVEIVIKPELEILW